MDSPAESTVIEKLAANALETRFENLEPGDLEHAKNRIIDVVGCLIGGANAPGNPELIDLVRHWGGRKEATILIHGGKAPAQNVAMVNSIMSRSFDFEPVSPVVEGKSTAGHVSGTTVMTAITMGEVKDIDGKELLTAVLVGDDVTSRVLLGGSTFGLSPGWDRIGPINPFGATAIAGRLLGLNKAQMKNSFGIVLNQIAGTFDIIQDTTTSFKLTQGTSARSGVFSAELAKAGWTGPKDALFGKFGYYYLYTEGCHDPGILTRDLGKKYYSDSTIKPYSCCRGCHGPVDCALNLVNKHGVEAGDIKEATIYISSGFSDNILALPFRIGEFWHANAIFSIQYCTAIALLKKSVKPEHFTEASVHDPEINAFVKKVRVAAELPQSEGQKARLKVILKDGRELTESVDVPRGDQLQNPISKDEIIAKFWTNVEFSRTVTKKNAEKLLAILEKLEELDSVNRIVPLLVA